MPEMTTKPTLDLSLPYITEGLQGIGGRLKKEPGHFIVEEIPLYEPTGEGTHLYVNITKENTTTRDVQLQLADLFELKPENVGKAGLKDKYARTTQTLSILLPNVDSTAEELQELIQGNVNFKVNWAKFHTNKLRAGHLLGNRFRITVSELELPVEEAYNRSLAVMDRIHLLGMPNYYGEQRTGEDGENIIAGLRILTGEKRLRNRWLRRYLISSYQSYLCNLYLSKRVRSGYMGILEGDIAKKHDTGGLFWVEDKETDQERYTRQEISFTAPIFGYKMSQPAGESLEFEEKLLEASGVSMGLLRKNRVTGTRRLGRILPKITVEKSGDDLVFSFKLSKGGYATTVMREFMKRKDSSSETLLSPES